MLSFLRKNIHQRVAVPAAMVGSMPPSHTTLLASMQSIGPAIPRRSLALLIGAAFSLPATAAISDTIHPFVAVTVTHDDNLFRLPEVGGGPDGGPRSDSIRQVQGGLLFNRPIGRQILSGQAKLSKVTFGHYKQLNYDGKDMLAALEWHLGNHVEGHAGINYAQSLTPFTDFISTERNLRVQRGKYFDAAWRFHPSWRVRGGVTKDRFEYELSTQHFNQRVETGLELGVDYLATSDSRIGLQLRQLKADYPNKRVFGSKVIDENYDQNEVKANIFWRFSGVTQVQLLGGWVQRKHDLFTQRDTSGTNGRVVVYWAPLGQVRFTGSGWREFGAVESNLVSSSLNTGASVSAVWDISAKISANASLRRETRDFSFAPNLQLASNSEDKTRTASIGLNYAPSTNIQLGASLNHEVRSGSAAIGIRGYNDNTVSFNARAQF